MDFTRAYEDLLALHVSYTRAERRFAFADHLLGDWMQGTVAHYGPQALPGMDLIPESLRDIWQVLLDKATIAFQNNTEVDLPMLDTVVGAVPEEDHRDLVSFLEALEARAEADRKGKFPLFN